MADTQVDVLRAEAEEWWLAHASDEEKAYTYSAGLSSVPAIRSQQLQRHTRREGALAGYIAAAKVRDERIAELGRWLDDASKNGVSPRNVLTGTYERDIEAMALLIGLSEERHRERIERLRAVVQGIDPSYARRLKDRFDALQEGDL